MHRKARFPNVIFGTSLRPESAALASLLMLLFLLFVLLFMTLTAQPVQAQLAQNSVPPTAREAAASPAFASKLHPSTPSAMSKPQAAARARTGRTSPQGQVIYENGPANGTTDAWTINFGYIVSDTFVPNSSNVSGFDLYVWEFSGDTMTSVQWSITSAPNGGTVYGSGTVGVGDTFISTNQYGYDIDEISATGLSVTVTSGSFYWVNLQNAVTALGDPVFWDENSGTGCNSPGCPSQAVESAVGTIPSEAFDITGGLGPNWPACWGVGDLQIIHNFAQPKGQGGPGLVTSTWAATQEKVLHSFNGYPTADGFLPYAGLTLDAAGNLYGTTFWGGSDGWGTVFELTPAAGGGWTETVLHSFNWNGTDGAGPCGGLTSDAAGNLYGTTDGGGTYGFGAVFELTPAAGGGWTEKMLHSFNAYDGGAGGYRPQSGLIFDAAGNLYGTTLEGAQTGGCLYGCGTVYQLTPAAGGGWTEKVLYRFSNGTDGGFPVAGLILDAAGKLYGTTIGGGTGDCGYGGGCGTVFELTGGTERVLHSFGNGTDGAYPFAGLIFDAAGNLYGTTSEGGTYNYGTVFKLTPTEGGGWTETVLHSFNGTDGHGPYAGLIFDKNGNLYGITGGGGTYGDGTVFELTPVGGGNWTETVLHSFNANGTDGAHPWASLIFDAAGNLYGTTGGGGTYNYGTVFELTPVYPCARCGPP